MAQIKTNQYSIADDAVTLAKMASGVDGNILTYDASGNPAVVASGTSGHFLKSQGADTVPVFAAAAAGGKVLQCVGNSIGNAADQQVTTNSATATALLQAITPTSATNRLLITAEFSVEVYDANGSSGGGGIELYRDINGAGFDRLDSGATGNTASIGNHRLGNLDGVTYWITRYGIHYWDASYDSTNVVTYKLYIAEADVDDDYFAVGSGSSLLTMSVMEIDES
jgi:hypothetical protein